MDLIDVGYARRPHGIGGEVVVRPLSDDPDRWTAGARFITDEALPRTLEATAVRPHHGDLLVRFDGIDDRDAAGTLRGVTFHVPASERRPLDDREFWPDDLVGCAVVTPDSTNLGTVVDVEFADAQDRLVVETASGSWVQVPLVSAIVPTVDLEARVITVSPPDGLF